MFTLKKLRSPVCEKVNKHRGLWLAEVVVKKRDIQAYCKWLLREAERGVVPTPVCLLHVLLPCQTEPWFPYLGEKITAYRTENHLLAHRIQFAFNIIEL